MVNPNRNRAGSMTPGSAASAFEETCTSGAGAGPAGAISGARVRIWARRPSGENSTYRRALVSGSVTPTVRYR